MLLGGDVAGEIDAMGAAVSSFIIGDPVMTYLVRRLGGYAEFVSVQAMFVVRKPARLSFAQAAALPVVGLTALQAVGRAGMRPGDSVLVTGASGGGGTMAVQLARLHGAESNVVTAGHNRSAHYLTGRLGIAPSQIVRYAGLSRQVGSCRQARSDRRSRGRYRGRGPARPSAVHHSAHLDNERSARTRGCQRLAATDLPDDKKG
jgi:hypothetical protein